MIFIFDIDGTLADIGPRMRAAGPEPTRDNIALYDAWLERLQSDVSLSADTPIYRAVQMARYLKSAGNEVLYLTGRSEKYRTTTEKWLAQVGAPKASLLMRTNDDCRTAAAYKEQQIRDSFNRESWANIVAVDDDPNGDTTAIYQKLGILHLKVMGI